MLYSRLNSGAGFKRVQIKPYKISSFLNRYHKEYSSILFYGTNNGLVSQRASGYAKLAASAFGIELTDSLCNIVLHADELESGLQRLLDEIYTVAFFAKPKIISLKHLTTQPNLCKLLAKLVEEDLPDCLLLIEAGELKKGNVLRNKIEASAHSMSLVCYNDEAESLSSLIDAVIAKNALNIDARAKQVLLQQLGSDYLLSKNELEKLCLYCAGKQHIAIEDIETIVSDVSALNLGTIIDYILVGDSPSFNRHFEQYIRSGESALAVLNTALRQFAQLQILRYELENTGAGATQLIEKLKPPVFYKRKKLLEAALQLWSLPAINRALTLLQQATLHCRLHNRSEAIITQQLGLKLAQAMATKTRFKHG